MLIFLSMLESDEERRLFTDLYNQYGNMMLHVAKRYFPKDMYAAEDVVQNAWIRVVDHFQKIQAVPSKKRGAYLVVIVRNEASGNRNDAISITVTLMQGSKEIASWSASGKGSVTISKTCKVETKKTYKLVLSATVNGVAKPDVSVTATAK